LLSAATSALAVMLEPKNPSRDRPRCPKCHAKMTLARTTPGSPGFEIRSLECPECHHAIVQRVPADYFHREYGRNAAR
jgi:ribosomal protein L37AE/L43A